MTCSPLQQTWETAPETPLILTSAHGDPGPQAAGQTVHLARALHFKVVVTLVRQGGQCGHRDKTVINLRAYPTVCDWNGSELLDHRFHLGYLLETSNNCLLGTYLSLIWVDLEGDPASLGQRGHVRHFPPNIGHR